MIWAQTNSSPCAFRFSISGKKCLVNAPISPHWTIKSMGLPVVVRELEGEQEFAVDVGEQGKADHGNGCN